MKKEENIPWPDTLLEGKYRLENEIGAGGMGRVFQATHVVIGHRVAIKMLRQKSDTDGDDEVLAARFLNEARAAGSIGHDNICEVTDVGHAPDGSPFLVMPLLKGESLDRLLGRGKLLDIGRAADITAQVLRALEAAHGRRIVHRDLKPGNVFLMRLGDRADFVKLLDFGISKALGDASTDITRTGAVAGTPNYMAPEQARGLRQTDERVDIYATGVMLYESLTLRRPFGGESYNDVLYKILTVPFPAPRTLRPEIPPELEAVILRAMSRDPSGRFSSAAEMRAALSRSVGLPISEPPRESPPPPSPIGESPTAQEPTLATQQSTIADTTTTDTSSGSASTTRQRVRRWTNGIAVTVGIAVISVAAAFFMGGTAEKSPPAAIPTPNVPLPDTTQPDDVTPVEATPSPVSGFHDTANEALESTDNSEAAVKSDVSATPREIIAPTQRRVHLVEKSKNSSKRQKFKRRTSPKSNPQDPNARGERDTNMSGPTSESAETTKGRFGTQLIKEYIEE